MRKVEFLIDLGNTDRYRHNHFSEGKKIIAFSLQYETFTQGKWLPVVRYDSAHGFAHRDLFDLNGIQSKTLLNINELNEALTFAESDLKSSWKIYKERFLGEYDEE